MALISIRYSYKVSRADDGLGFRTPEQYSVNLILAVQYRILLPKKVKIVDPTQGMSKSAACNYVQVQSRSENTLRLDVRRWGCGYSLIAFYVIGKIPGLTYY